MNEKQKIFRRYLPVFFTVLILAATFRICALFIDFNTETIYFDGKILISFANWIAGIGSILLVTYAFFGDKKAALIANFSTPATFVPTLLISVALIFFAVSSYITLKELDTNIRDAIARKNVVYILLLALALLAVLSVGYFLMNALVLSRSSVARAGFGIIAVIFFALYSTYLYFSTELPINSPNKTVDQMAFLFTALFFLYEIRISLGRECWHLYIAFGFVAATLTAFSSIPSIIYYFTRGITVSNSIHESVLTLCIFIFIFARLILAGTLKEDKVSDSVLIMKCAAEERAAFIKEREDISRLAYLELFGRMSENSESDDEASEKDVFPTEGEDNADNAQISFPDEIFNVTVNDGAYSDSEEKEALPDGNEDDSATDDKSSGADGDNNAPDSDVSEGNAQDTSADAPDADEVSTPDSEENVET